MISACVDGKTACWASFIMMIDFDNVIDINFVNISTRIYGGYLGVFCDHLMLKFVIPVNQVNNDLHVKQESKPSHENESYCRQVFYLLLGVMAGDKKERGYIKTSDSTPPTHKKCSPIPTQTHPLPPAHEKYPPTANQPKKTSTYLHSPPPTHKKYPHTSAYPKYTSTRPQLPSPPINNVHTPPLNQIYLHPPAPTLTKRI